jgi:RNA polymerase sigma-70 factor, ECF subfamily
MESERTNVTIRDNTVEEESNSQVEAAVNELQPGRPGLSAQPSPNREAPGAGQHSDEELMTQIREQGSGALEELYRRHHVFLRGLAMGIVHSESDTQDVLQSVFVAIWNGGTLKYRAEKGRPLGWLVTMTKRRAIDLVRKRISYLRRCDAYQAEATIAPQSTLGVAAHEIDAAEYRAIAARALERLPDKQRVALELAFVSGLSQRAIAARLGVPVGTIKTRLSLALLKVRRYLSDVSRELQGDFGKT